MKSPFKTEMRNLPLSIPVAWVDFFDDQAATLGISRNAVFRLAMKFGGPIVHRLCEVASERLKESVKNLEFPSDFVASDGFSVPVVLKGHDERTNYTTARRGTSQKPGGREEKHGQARFEATARTEAGRRTAGRQANPNPAAGVGTVGRTKTGKCA